MAGQRPKIDFILLDERNAILFNAASTEYIMSKVRQATAEPGRRREIYAEMAKRFHVDPDKINLAVIKYVDRLNRERKRRILKPEGNEKNAPEVKMDERVLLAELCRQVGHRYVTIQLSHRHGCQECERCGKHESRYNI